MGTALPERGRAGQAEVGRVRLVWGRSKGKVRSKRWNEGKWGDGRVRIKGRK